jgi:hypothetical protein
MATKRQRQSPQHKHANHTTGLRTGSGPHAAALYCEQCNKHIQWITAQELEQIQKLFPDMKICPFG